MNRRKLLQSTAAAGAAGLAAAALARPALAQDSGGRLRQSVCFWTYQKWFTLDQLCQEAARIGLKGIDLVTPAQYATVQFNARHDGVHHPERHPRRPQSR